MMRKKLSLFLSLCVIITTLLIPLSSIPSINAENSSDGFQTVINNFDASYCEYLGESVNAQNYSEYTKHEHSWASNWYYNKVKTDLTSDRNITQNDVFIEYESQDNKAMHFKHVMPYNSKSPSGFLIFNPNGADDFYNTCIKDTKGEFKVSLKAKGTTNNVNLYVGWSSATSKFNYAQTHIDNFVPGSIVDVSGKKNIAMVYSLNSYNDWQTLEFTFDISKNLPPDESSGLYICMISQGNERKAADWWIDDVKVEKISNEGTPGKVWSGKIASSYDGGEGTKENPYQIATAEQLARLVKRGCEYDECFILTNDIILNTDFINNPHQWYGFSDTAAAFKGNFDGQGYKVTGLYFNGNDSSALFPNVYSGDNPVCINNLNIANSYIKCVGSGNSGSNMAAAFAGFSNDTTLSINFNGCIVESDVTVEGVCAGGFLARAANPIISLDSCAFAGKLKYDEGKPHGAIFASWEAKITAINSYFNCIPATSLNLGSLTVENSYATENPDKCDKFILVSIDAMQDTKAKENMPLLDWGKTWSVSDSYPIRYMPPVWDGTADDSWKNSGTGIETDPYLISTAEQLFSVVGVESDQTKDKYFKLVSDIHLNNTKNILWYLQSINKVWSTSNGQDGKGFKGVFDGSNHTVYGIYYNGVTDAKYLGLFPIADEGAVIKNLNIDKSYLKAKSGMENTYIGAIVGANINGDLKLEQCYVNEGVQIFAKNGSLLGKADGNAEISSCAFLGSFGETASNALKITKMRTYKSTWPRYFLITDTENKLFRPLFDVEYTVSFKYKIEKAASRDINLELRWTRNKLGDKTTANGDGPSGVNGTVVMDSKYRITDLLNVESGKTVTEWKTVEKTFTVSQSSSPQYQIEKRGLSVVVNDGNKWSTDSETDIELWIDDFEIKKGNETVVINDYDSAVYTIDDSVSPNVLKLNDTVVSNNNNYISIVPGGIPFIADNKGFVADSGITAKITVSDSFTTAVSTVGGIGEVNYSNTYCTGNTEDGLIRASKSDMQGRMVMYTAMPLLNWGNTWKTTDSYPMPITENDIFGSIGAIWSGKCATWLEGAGTKEYPFIVDTAERLYLMVTKPVKDAQYLITEDIVLNDTTDRNWYEAKNLNSWYEASSGAFNAKVDSGKKDSTLAIVSGLYRKNTKANCALIPILGSNAEIYNIRVKDSYISGLYNPEVNILSGSSIAAIAAYVTGNKSVIEGCIVEESVTLQGGWATGGIVAAVSGSVLVSNCAFKGNFIGVGGRGVFGGIVATDWGVTQIESCYTVGSYLNNKLDATFGHIYNCYSDVDIADTTTGTYHKSNVTVLTKQLMSGAGAKSQMPLLDFNNIWSTTATYPDILQKIATYDGEEGEVWSGKKAATYAGGIGTKNDPYIIKTGEQLFKMVSDNAPKAYYRLEADIVLNKTDGEFWYEESTDLNMWRINRIDGFKGHLDGNYHTVSGLYYCTGDNGRNVFAALIPYAASGCLVEKVGIINSAIILPRNANGAASIVGEVRAGTAEKRPVISECFADSSVYLQGSYAGGIVCRSGSSPVKVANPVLQSAPVEIVNCLFTGSLTASKNNAGTIIGYVRGASESLVKNCFGSSLDNDRMIGGNTEYGAKRGNNDDGLIENCYYYATSVTAGAEAISYADRIGLKTETIMSKLDFENIWLAVADGTPVLRGFSNPERFSDKGIRTSTITFVTGDREVIVPSITAEIETSLTLPTPTRKGYIFEGWYVYEEYQIKFESKTMPLCNLTLYAKWKLDGVVQDFEDYTNSEYDMGKDYEYFKPGTRGYNAKYTHGGYKSMHRKGNTADEQDVLINYKDPLTVDQEYEMIFWVATDKEGTTADISLVHNSWPDVAEYNLGVEKMVSISSLTKGEWVKYTYTFKAKSNWVSIRTTGNASLYFDDIMICPIGERLGSAVIIMPLDKNADGVINNTDDRLETGEDNYEDFKDSSTEIGLDINKQEDTDSNNAKTDSSSEVVTKEDKKTNSKVSKTENMHLDLIITISIFAFVILLIVFLCLLIKRRKNKREVDFN